MEAVAASRIPARGGLPGLLFLLAFGAVFALAGLASLLFAVGTSPMPGEEGRLIPVVVGSIFLLAGLGIMAAALKSRGSAATRLGLAAEHPDEPWLWRPDWKNGRIRSSQGRAALFLWIFAIFWNAIAWTIASSALADLGDQPTLLLVLLFPLVGLLVLGLAVTQTLRNRRFGANILELETIPGVLGGEIRGRIVSEGPLEPETGLQLRLYAVNAVTTGTGKSRHTHEQLLFATTATLGRDDLEQSSAGTIIPVRLAIPFGPRASDDSNPNDRIVWYLEARAELVGADYHQKFEVPVFVTGDSDREMAERPPRPIDLDEAARLGSPWAGSAIGLSRLGDGAVELDFRAGRNPALTAVLAVVALVWGAICCGLFLGDAGLLIPLVFGLFEVLILLALLHVAFASSLVHVRPEGIGWEKRALGFMRRGWQDREEIAGLSVDVGSQSGSKVYHRLRLDLRSGKTITLGDGIPDRAEAVALQSLVEKILGPR